MSKRVRTAVPLVAHQTARLVIKAWREEFEICKRLDWSWGTPGRFVYFAEAEDGTLKIGYSANPIRRIKTLRCAPIVVIDSADRPNEQELHGACSAFRLHGEWYLADSPVSELAKRLQAVAEGSLINGNCIGAREHSIKSEAA